MKKIGIIILSFIATMPLFAYAAYQTASVPSNLNEISDVNDLVTRLRTIGDVVIYLLVALAVIFIVYYVVVYFIRGDKPEDRKKAGLNILWGIVGLAIIVSLWGLVNILIGTFSTNNAVPADRFPTVNFINQQR